MARETVCDWLNTDVCLSRFIDPKDLGQAFANGFLFGELLYKLGCLPDLSGMVDEMSERAATSNLSQVRASLMSVGVMLDASLAGHIYMQTPGAAGHLLYKIYINIKDKEKESDKNGENGQEEKPNPIAGQTNQDASKHYNLQYQLLKKSKYWAAEKREHIVSMQEKIGQDRQRLQKKLGSVRALTKPLPRKINKLLERKKAEEWEANETKNAISEFEKRREVVKPDSQSVKSADNVKEKVIQQQETDITFLQSKINLHAASIRNNENKMEQSVYQGELINQLSVMSQLEREIARKFDTVLKEEENLKVAKLKDEQLYQEQRKLEFERLAHRKQLMREELDKQRKEQIDVDTEEYKKKIAAKQHKQQNEITNFCCCLFKDMVTFSTLVAEIREDYKNDIHNIKILLDELKQLFVYDELPAYDTVLKADGHGELDYPENTISNLVRKNDFQTAIDSLRLTNYLHCSHEWFDPDIFDLPVNNCLLGHILGTCKKVLSEIEMANQTCYDSDIQDEKYESAEVSECTNESTDNSQHCNSWLKIAILGPPHSGKTTLAKKIAANFNLEYIDIPNLIETVLNYKETYDEEENDVSEEYYDITPAGLQDTYPATDIAEIQEHKDVTEGKPEDKMTSENYNGDSLKEAEDLVIKDSDQTLSRSQPLADCSGKSHSSNNKTQKIENYWPETACSSQSAYPTTRPKSCKKIPRDMQIRSGSFQEVGEAVRDCLLKGNCIGDDLFVELIQRHIRKMQSGQGWVIDGFPQTYSQLLKLEKSLADKVDSFFKHPSRFFSRLVSDPLEDKSSLFASTSMHLVFLLNISPEKCIFNAASNYFDRHFKSFNRDNNELPFVVGNDAEKRMECIEKEISTRIFMYHENIGCIQTWYKQTGVLQKIDELNAEQTIFELIEHYQTETGKEVVKDTPYKGGDKVLLANFSNADKIENSLTNISKDGICNEINSDVQKSTTNAPQGKSERNSRNKSHQRGQENYMYFTMFFLFKNVL